MGLKSPLPLPTRTCRGPRLCAMPQPPGPAVAAGHVTRPKLDRRVWVSWAGCGLALAGGGEVRATWAREGTRGGAAVKPTAPRALQVGPDIRVTYCQGMCLLGPLYTAGGFSRPPFQPWACHLRVHSGHYALTLCIDLQRGKHRYVVYPVTVCFTFCSDRHCRSPRCQTHEVVGSHQITVSPCLAFWRLASGAAPSRCRHLRGRGSWHSWLCCFRMLSHVCFLAKLKCAVRRAGLVPAAPGLWAEARGSPAPASPRRTHPACTWRCSSCAGDTFIQGGDGGGFAGGTQFLTR